MAQRRNKYGNKKVVVNGIKFDSQKEARRYTYLRMLQNAGKITDLQMQKEYVLIPSQREPDSIGKRGGKIRGKVIERKVSYIADFAYMQDGEDVVEDTKGVLTPDYVIKRKLMLYIHGIRISEIRG